MMLKSKAPKKTYKKFKGQSFVSQWLYYGALGGGSWRALLWDLKEKDELRKRWLYSRIDIDRDAIKESPKYRQQFYDIWSGKTPTS